MRVAILELLTDAPVRSLASRLYSRYFRKQFVSIMPQAISVWCRELGHAPHYATYYGQCDPLSLVPADAEIVFIAAYTQASALAYALAKILHARGITTVLGGPHAKSFPADCLRFFDLVVKDCDKTLVSDILRGRFTPPAIVTSGRPLTDLPSVEERMPEISAAVFERGRPTITSLVPILSSTGCPYSCDFCTDWNSRYQEMPKEKLRADLAYLATHYPDVLVGYHDPNFAVRFDQTMDVIESIPAARRNRYIMESSLSVLKPARLHRLKATRCIYVAPGVESWGQYSNKAGAAGKQGLDKLNQVTEHFEAIRRFVPGLQANFIFGTDEDCGAEPVELTKEFVRRAPFVFPSVNIPCPFGGTPLFDRMLAEGRLLRAMPFALYYNPYLVVVLRNYEPGAYYRHLIDIAATVASTAALAHRLFDRGPPALRLVHALRSLAVKREMNAFCVIERKLSTDGEFRAFHEGRSESLPEWYRTVLRGRLGRYADVLSDQDLTPVLQ